MELRAISTEKAVKLIDVENTMVFQTGRNVRRDDIKREVERLFKVKVAKVRTLVRKNKKYAYVKMAKENPAIDIATKLGMI